MSENEEPGRDLENRAALYRIVLLGAPLATALRELSPEALARIGLTDDKLNEVGGISHIFSRALWASTADLSQRGEHEFANQVAARARELIAEAEKK